MVGFRILKLIGNGRRMGAYADFLLSNVNFLMRDSTGDFDFGYGLSSGPRRRRSIDSSGYLVMVNTKIWWEGCQPASNTLVKEGSTTSHQRLVNVTN